MGGPVTNNQVAQDNDGGSFLDDMIGNFDDADEIRRRVQNELEERNQRKEASSTQTMTRKHPIMQQLA